MRTETALLLPGRSRGIAVGGAGGLSKHNSDPPPARTGPCCEPAFYGESVVQSTFAVTGCDIQTETELLSISNRSPVISRKSIRLARILA